MIKVSSFLEAEFVFFLFTENVERIIYAIQWEPSVIYTYGE